MQKKNPSKQNKCITFRNHIFILSSICISVPKERKIMIHGAMLKKWYFWIKNDSNYSMIPLLVLKRKHCENQTTVLDLAWSLARDCTILAKENISATGKV